ncbi:neutral zinc metallopeptidase [Gemmatimonas sp.]|uniref:KPN_02809 family neutral zinc metallopeptidase n=1 Tax=Gemmatimonas sp. TaxID=1962908 RepID=UPI0022BA770B|nr:neutral zinc metallopeptidase [Gemmatimonas sp.]MCA2985340.1 neutral zinc metallopeptidase [Gemmatimonas sp.]MCA2996358.1 neutral zinc metallopeptidase [Gemmatimonas sp.]MCZ8013528.1 zinc metallopeptidase [Gemmatimonas sp.]MCZ8265784.1 zinc metallopeptidase [Gemmatimonas sp.]
MRWSPGGRSRNLEDRRGGGGGAGGMGGGGFRGGGMKLGVGGMLVLIVLSYVFKTDLVTPITGGSGVGAPMPTAEQAPLNDPAEERMVQFVSVVLDSAQATWARQMSRYRPARLVLFRDATPTACGTGQSASGPFYCPGDEKVYIDLSFFDQLHRQFGAPGDFAQAYVIAHEIGHHVQNVLGTEQQVRRLQQENPRAKNALSVAMELQADCYAGVWAHDAARARMLEPGDLEEGLGAAAAVGDDRLQQMAGGRVQRESFTHGSSADRQQWFRRGFEQGDPGACDTFAAMR